MQYKAPEFVYGHMSMCLYVCLIMKSNWEFGAWIECLQNILIHKSFSNFSFLMMVMMMMKIHKAGGE